MAIEIFDYSTQKIFESFAIAASSTVAASALFAVIRSGFIRSIRIGGIEAEFQISRQDLKEISDNTNGDSIPFESAALSKYYNHVLQRASISFWFSLLFASIGFGVIIFAFTTHNANDFAASALKLTGGIVIDAVAGLFFVQSAGAQKSMGEFFEKLRLDRMSAEGRELLKEIENVERRDQLRAQLVLKYAGIDALISDVKQT